MVDKPTILGVETSLELQRERDMRVQALQSAAEAELRVQEQKERADDLCDQLDTALAERDHQEVMRHKAERSAEHAWSIAIGLAVCLAGIGLAMAISIGFRHS